jgi:hypothetical protein
MASLRKQTANSWQIRVVVRGEKINLSFSDLTEWQARTMKRKNPRNPLGLSRSVVY